ncbi:MAG: hypothetical protein PW735_12350 [Acidobacteriaceae bacterium]|nr:hypothetical protein [Acidobacteriaceae bacterium]
MSKIKLALMKNLMPTRRKFLSLSVAAAGTLALPRTILASDNEINSPYSNAALGAYTQGLMNAEYLTTLVGTSFTVFLTDGSYSSMVLSKVTVMDNTPASTEGKRVAPPGADLTALRSPLQPTCFTLCFNVTGQSFAEGTYLLDSGLLGRVSMFLSPSTAGKCVASFSAFPQRTMRPVTSPVKGRLTL